MRWPPRAARVGSLKAAVSRMKAARGRGWVLEERGLPELAVGEVQRPAPGAARQPAGHGEESPAHAAGGAERPVGEPPTLVQRSRLGASAAMTVHAGLAKKRPLAPALQGAAAAAEPAAAERGLGDPGGNRARSSPRLVDLLDRRADMGLQAHADRELPAARVRGTGAIPEPHGLIEQALDPEALGERRADDDPASATARSSSAGTRMPSSPTGPSSFTMKVTTSRRSRSRQLGTVGFDNQVDCDVAHEPAILGCRVRARQRPGTSATASTSTWISGHTIAVGTRSMPAGSCVIISFCTATYVLMSSSRVRYWRMLTMSLIEAPASSRMAATFRHACRASSAKSAGMLPFSSRPGVPDTTIWS